MGILSRWSRFLVRPLTDVVGSSYFEDSKYQSVLSIGGIWAFNCLATQRYGTWYIFRINWKSKEHHCKLPIAMLALENIAHEPNFLELVQHGGVSEGAIDCNSSKRNAWTVPDSNISSREQVWSVFREPFRLSKIDKSVLLVGIPFWDASYTSAKIFRRLRRRFR